MKKKKNPNIASVLFTVNGKFYTREKSKKKDE